MFNQTRILASILGMAISALPIAALAQGGPAPVGVDVVKIEPLTQTSPVIGRLVSRKFGPIAARTSGPVDEVLVGVGDKIKEGDIIARLDVRRQQAEVDLRKSEVAEYQGRIAMANASLRKAQQEMQRMESLRSSAAFQKGRLEDLEQTVAEARGSLAVARAEATSSKASADQAEIELNDSEIRAPFDGVVTIKHVESGAWVNAGQPVVTLLSDQDLEVEAAVPSRIIAGVKSGVVVKIRLGESDFYDAVIRAVIPEENPLTRTRIVRAIPDLSAGATLAAGQSAIMMVPIGEPRDVITVHKDAVLNRAGTNLVVLVVDGKAEFRPVQIGDAVGSRFEILEGLAPGDVAVVRGNERLRPGQAVAPAGKKAPNNDEKPAAAKTDSQQKAQGES